MRICEILGRTCILHVGGHEYLQLEGTPWWTGYSNSLNVLTTCICVFPHNSGLGCMGSMNRRTKANKCRPRI